MTLRYEGVRFSDGSVAVRRVADDPCERATLTFETLRALEEDVGSADVTWIADRRRSEPPSEQQHRSLMACQDCWSLDEDAKNRRADCWSWAARCCVCGKLGVYCTGTVKPSTREWLIAKRRELANAAKPPRSNLPIRAVDEFAQPLRAEESGGLSRDQASTLNRIKRGINAGMAQFALQHDNRERSLLDRLLRGLDPWSAQTSRYEPTEEIEEQ